MLLKAGADVNVLPVKGNGHTALQAAASGRHRFALDILLKAGAEVNAPPALHAGRSESVEAANKKIFRPGIA